MNLRAIDILAGLKPQTESTMTTSMGTNVAGPAAIMQAPLLDKPKAKRSKLADLLSKRKLRQEAASQSVIPADANPDGTASAGQGGQSKEAPVAGKPSSDIEPLLPTSIALVAPDTTPYGDKPLDPSQVPQPATPVQSQPVQPTKPAAPAETDVLRTLIGQHQSNFKPGLITNPTESIQAVNKSMDSASSAESLSSPVAVAKAAQVLSEAQSGKNPEPHYNPNSLNQAIAATRLILGD